MNWLRCIFAVSLGICGLCVAPDASADATCRITGSAMPFGSVAASGATDAVGYIDYECDVSSPGNSGNAVSLQMCVGLGASPGGTLADRRMDGIDDAAGPNPDQLPFGLFKDSARSSGWGESIASSPTYLVMPAFTVTPPAGGVQKITGSIDVYGRIPDSLVAAGDYAASLPGILYYGSKNQAEKVECTGTNSNGVTDRFLLPVTATVPGRCTALAADPRMDFGTLIGTNTGVLTSTVAISLECTNRTAWQLGLDDGKKPASDGSRQMCTSPDGPCLRYQLTRPQAYGGGRWGNTAGTTVDDASTGSPQTVTVSGTVPDQPLTRAGAYTDIIKVVLTY